VVAGNQVSCALFFNGKVKCCESLQHLVQVKKLHKTDAILDCCLCWSCHKLFLQKTEFGLFLSWGNPFVLTYVAGKTPSEMGNALPYLDLGAVRISFFFRFQGVLSRNYFNCDKLSRE
jgi:hypothetical protein